MAYFRGVIRNIHLQRIWWALKVPSFLELSESVSYFLDEQHEQDILKLLYELEKNSAMIDEHFEMLGSMPMGRYFEQLLVFILKRDSRYEVLAHNLQLVEGKVTKGELDLVLIDRVHNKKMHWEVALKYYLQIGKTGSHNNFLGPSKRDYLGRKMVKLKEAQLPLAKHPIIREDFGELESRLFLKGQLFYPLGKEIVLPENANAKAQCHFYLPLGDFKNSELMADKHFRVLKKPHWIGPEILSENERMLDHHEILQTLEMEMERIDRPQMIAAYALENGFWQEQNRYFISPSVWPGSAIA